VPNARIALEPAFLLSARSYRETSQLLEVLTPNHGRVGLVARGARGPKARQRGVLAPFRPLLLSWLEAGDLGTLTESEAAGPDTALVGERIFHGWYLNELLLKLLQRHDPHPDIFDNYRKALNRLAGSELEAEAALRVFEKRLLEQLGYGPSLEQDFEPGLRYRHQLDGSFVPIEGEAPGLLAGSSLIALREECLDQRNALDDARRLLRRLLEPHVPHDSLRTPKLLRETRQLHPRVR
jgi:DNA repair protein RecO (recombination protein O)